MTGDDGRAGREAARLLGAAQEWLRDAAPHLAPVSAEGETCSCPLCRAVVAVREADPETVGRWVDVAVAGMTSALSQAATAAGASPDDGAASTGGAQTVDEPWAEATAEHDVPDAPDPADPADEGSGGRAVRRIPLDDGTRPSSDDRLA